MRLLGVVRSTSVLSSRLGTGGIAGACLIEEFSAQMRAVSKIALHRRSNFATFLEINGIMCFHLCHTVHMHFNFFYGTYCRHS